MLFRVMSSRLWGLHGGLSPLGVGRFTRLTGMKPLGRSPIATSKNSSKVSLVTSQINAIQFVHLPVLANSTSDFAQLPSGMDGRTVPLANCFSGSLLLPFLRCWPRWDNQLTKSAIFESGVAKGFSASYPQAVVRAGYIRRYGDSLLSISTALRTQRPHRRSRVFSRKAAPT